VRPYLLQHLCNTRPLVAPVKFVPKMKQAVERLGLVTEAGRLLRTPTPPSMTNCLILHAYVCVSGLGDSCSKVQEY